jgi:AraC-like DNA-binding protein
MADDDDERGHLSLGDLPCLGRLTPHRASIHGGPQARQIAACSVGTSIALGTGMAEESVPAQIRRALVENVQLGEATSARSWVGHFGTPLSGRPVAHDGIEVGWVRSGHAEYRIEGGRAFAVKPGELVIVPAGAGHATSFAGDLAAGAIELAGETARAIAESVGEARSLRAGIVVDIGDVRALVAALEEELHAPGAGRAFAVSALAEALLVRVLRRSADDDSSRDRRNARDPRIRRALDYLETNASESIEVSDLARAAGMSRFHFSRIFRDETGASPYAYLVDRRLDRVAARLRAGGTSVTAAALDAGFRDLGRFGRAFKTRFGKTASAYAQDFLTSSTCSSTRPTQAWS